MFLRLRQICASAPVQSPPAPAPRCRLFQAFAAPFEGSGDLPEDLREECPTEQVSDQSLKWDESGVVEA